MIVIRHAAVYTEHEILVDGAVAIDAGRIMAVTGAEGIAEGSEELDGSGLLLIPGLIDMQCNGLVGHDVLAGDPQTVSDLVASLPRYGCTGVLPTIVTSRYELTRRCLEAIAAVAREPGI